MGFLNQPNLPETFVPFAALRGSLGFVPGLFLAQSLKPEFIEAEVQLVSVISREDKLSRRQKESIAVVCSAANLNTYCVTSHCEMLKGLGSDEEEMTQIAVDHHFADLPAADVALLDFVLKLNKHGDQISAADIDVLRGHGFSDEQILEAVAMTAYNSFFNTLSFGLGVLPDFEPKPLRRATASDTR